MLKIHHLNSPAQQKSLHFRDREMMCYGPLHSLADGGLGIMCLASVIKYKKIPCFHAPKDSICVKAWGVFWTVGKKGPLGFRLGLLHLPLTTGTSQRPPSLSSSVFYFP